MKKQAITLGIFVTLLQASVSLAEPPNILPGLWETKVDISSKSGQIEAAMEQAKQMMASMPPEQQKMMKEMMAKQGVSIDFGTRTVRTCLTQTQIDKFALPDADEDCTQELTQKAKGRFTMTMTCPQQNMSGSGEFVIKDQKNYSGTISMDIDMNGQKDTMNMQQSGNWISSDCGAISQ